MKQHLHLLILLLFALPVEAQPTLESLLRAVDAAIEDSEQYEKDKMQRITLIKDGLKVSGLSLEEEYRINLRLYTEYEAYICDSARHYINRNIELAVRLNNREWLNESKLKKVHILATSGLYAEGLRLLETINKQHLSDRLLVDYYMAFENIYLYYAEYAQDDEYMPGYLDKMNSYRDSVLMIVPEGSYQYVIVQGPMLIYHQQPKEAENLLKTYISGVSSDTREYAILTSILAFTYQNDSQLELQNVFG